MAKKASFREIGERAAYLEQQGELSAASTVWSQAAMHATNSKNREWAIRRSAYCKRWHTRIEG